MKSLGWLIVFLLAGLAISIAVGFGFSAKEPVHYDAEQEGLDKKVIIRFSHVVAENTPKGLAVSRFAQLVREKTDGMVEIRVYPNATLFDDEKEFQALQTGKVEMIAPATSKLSSRYPAWMIMDLPYAFKNESEVKEAMDGRLGQLLFKAINDENIKGLALWDNGFKQMTANRPLIDPEDFKQMKFRIMASTILQAQFRALGAKAESYSFNDLYRQLQFKNVEGEENTLSNIYSKRLYQVQRHMTVSNHGYLGYIVLINKTTWDKLSPKQRAAIESAMAETTAWIRQYAKKMNDRALAEMKAKNLIHIHMQTNKEKEAWKKRLAPVYYQFKDTIGTQVLEEWKKLGADERALQKRSGGYE
ncbi:DctP family TRAP transporter solute-binding subunit [Aneurinibacillus thermoaerophilus]|uniref:DctP family TRAP transporter solute-binding subunit n=1 Tax=Aneurinibacillus thermoaerophilus TaxID=143495 RepID=UPI002E206345|nr:DctP family TRAP transporter solute-binding subunit [Aneurinibacillus thermoaerophilus]MED0679762.1 DctP family TRAP transporter solute-binding subunit [Aneurinibacillus thermoaerophilus]MED0763982.1 DctP family TRAP transporter solute-binding subunit [Aneurinibacillus thermoaerophilus]